MESRKLSSKPHAVFIPFPLQGHITPMIKLAQLFHQRGGFYITFINTEFAHNCLFKTNSKTSFPLDCFNFETFPDGLPTSYDSATKDLLYLCEYSRKNFAKTLGDFVSEINSRQGVPPLSCIVSDVQMGFTIKIAQEIGVPAMLFWTASACSFWVYKHYRYLMDRGIPSARGEKSDNVVDCVHGLKNIRYRDIPFDGEFLTDFPMKEVEDAIQASCIIFNSFQDLEEDAFSSISSLYPKVYAIGPLQMVQNLTIGGESKSVCSNLWEEESQCIKWLDSMKPNSVVYISFGSLLFLKHEQLFEFAWGILNSNFPFLWIMRSDTTRNQQPTALPPDLLAMLALERGLIASWCPQQEVLNHPAIGGFITHSGWNSILDTVCAGVPVICCPCWGDQPINSRYSCTNWEIGMEANYHYAKRDEIEKLVRELMDGEKSMNSKKKVMEWKKLAQDATSHGGSSFMNLETLMKEAAQV